MDDSLTFSISSSNGYSESIMTHHDDTTFVQDELPPLMPTTSLNLSLSRRPTALFKMNVEDKGGFFLVSVPFYSVYCSL